MSGHSKWHNIQKTKGAADAKRSAAFTKIAKEIIVAVKEGGGSGDPSTRRWVPETPRTLRLSPMRATVPAVWPSSWTL